jgi:hypothetical protein
VYSLGNLDSVYCNGTGYISEETVAMLHGAGETYELGRLRSERDLARDVLRSMGEECPPRIVIPEKRVEAGEPGESVESMDLHEEPVESCSGIAGPGLSLPVDAIDLPAVEKKRVVLVPRHEDVMAKADRGAATLEAKMKKKRMGSRKLTADEEREKQEYTREQLAERARTGTLFTVRDVEMAWLDAISQKWPSNPGLLSRWDGVDISIVKNTLLSKWSARTAAQPPTDRSPGSAW